MFFWYSFKGGQNIHLHNFFIHQMINNRFKFDKLKSQKPIPTNFGRQTIKTFVYFA
jgi:hypothetical protein